MICNNQYSKPRSIDVFAKASQHWHTMETCKNFRRCHCETVEPSFLLCQEAPWPLGRAVDGCMVRRRPNSGERFWFTWSGNSDSHLIVLASFLRRAFVRYLQKQMLWVNILSFPQPKVKCNGIVASERWQQQRLICVGGTRDGSWLVQDAGPTALSGSHMSGNA